MENTLLISGIGAISVAGSSLRENWEQMEKGQSCIRPIRHIPTEGLTSQNAGQIYLSNEELLARLQGGLRSHKRLPAERGELLLMVAFEEALRDAGLTPESLQGKRVGILVGTSLSGFTELERHYVSHKKSGRRIPPSAFLTYPLHVCLDRMAHQYGLQGPRVLYSTACSASLHPFVMAQEFFRSGEIDVAVIGGTDPLSLMSLAGFSTLKSLSKEACSPFSQTDLGISIGEGAGVLILEDSRSLLGKKPEECYAQVLGTWGTSDAYHPTASNPTGETIRKCVEEALDGQDPQGRDIMVMAHGTGTPHNDMVETRALKQVKILEGMQVSAVKSVVGHTLGASGALELVMMAKAMKDQTVLPIANWSEPRQGCDLDYVVGSPRQVKRPLGIKSAFAFGGNNVAVSLGDLEDRPRSYPLLEEASDPLVISGLGLISSLDAFEKEELKEKIRTGASGIKDIPALKGFARNQTISKAAVADQEALSRFSIKKRIKNYRKMDQISRLSTLAAAQALSDAGLKVTAGNTHRIGLLSATGTGALESVCDFYTQVLDKGVRMADANVFPNTVVNAHLGYVSIELGIKGYTTVIAQGNSSPFATLKLARQLLTSGRCDAVLVGASSEYSQAYHRALADIGYLSPQEVQKPYSPDSDGNVLGEAGVFFVLEPLSKVTARGGVPYCRLGNVELEGHPGFPGTYGMETNPLEPVLSRLADIHGVPSVVAGEGNGLKEDWTREWEALQKTWPNTGVWSPAQTFGYVPGVNPFLSLALFALFHKEGIPGTGKPAADSAAVVGLAPGGMAGGFWLSSL